MSHLDREWICYGKPEKPHPEALNTTATCPWCGAPRPIVPGETILYFTKSIWLWIAGSKNLSSYHRKITLWALLAVSLTGWVYLLINQLRDLELEQQESIMELSQLRWENQGLATQLANTGKDIENVQSQLEQLKKEIQNLNTQISKLSKERGNLQKMLTQKQKENQSLSAQLSTLQREIETLRSQSSQGSYNPHTSSRSGYSQPVQQPIRPCWEFDTCP